MDTLIYQLLVHEHVEYLAQLVSNQLVQYEQDHLSNYNIEIHIELMNAKYTQIRISLIFFFFVKQSFVRSF